MSEFNLEDHICHDADIERIEIFEEAPEVVALVMEDGAFSDAICISEEDSIAFAKYFGHYKEPEETE